MKKFLIVGTSICFVVLLIGWAFRLWIPSREKIHPALPANSFYSFTLTRSDARIPCLQAEIEEIPFLAKLDMGYDGVLSLPKHLLQQLTHKCHSGTILFASIKGKKYENSVFTIPKLNIGNLVLANLPVEEGDLEFERDISFGTNTDLESSDVLARIGWRAFVGTVFLIDLRRSIAICCDSLETLRENGYPLEQFVSTDFLSGEQFMEFEADIGNRLVKCLLDTGCTLNLIHAPSGASNATDGELVEFGSIDFTDPLPSIALSISGRHLGPCIFHKTQLPFGAQAIVGVDFLETQVICIDLVNNKLYLNPISEDHSLDSQAISEKNEDNLL
ncbi:MAG: hypothetical protein WA347_03185 [Rhabdochlamydiaceae bacterium]|jgi:hypothetical protein